MGTRANIFAGVAASALFYIVQTHLVGLAFPWDVVATLGVFAIASGLALWSARRGEGAKPRGSLIMSDIQTKKTLTAGIDGLNTQSAPDRVMSGIKSEGSVNLEIKNSNFNADR